MPRGSSDSPNDKRSADEGAEETLRDFEAAVAKLPRPTYLFRLYVAGNTARSAQAITNLRRICDRYLAGFYELEVIDVYQRPGAAKEADIIAVPTLIKYLPLPVKRFLGDMSDEEKIVVGLKLGSQNQ
jgi:circadian clock protein KaiB